MSNSQEKGIKQLLATKTDKTLIQLFRYFFVGGFAFIVDWGSLYVLTEFFEIYYLISAAISFVLGLFVNYFISIIWVFGNSTVSNRWIEFLIFTIIGIIGLALNEVIMYLGSNVLELYFMFSKLCSTGIVFFWNFYARKIILYKHKHK